MLELAIAIMLSATMTFGETPPERPMLPEHGKIETDIAAKPFVRVVSGNPELDIYLDELLAAIGAGDADALRRAYDLIGDDEVFSYVEMDVFEAGSPDTAWSIPCALEMAQTHTGNCYRYAALMSWIARALGYDAEAVSGLVLLRDGWAAHAWIEVHVDGKTYIIDPQQHARSWNEDLDFFMVTYEEAPFYYVKSWDDAW